MVRLDKMGGWLVVLGRLGGWVAEIGRIGWMLAEMGRLVGWLAVLGRLGWRLAELGRLVGHQRYPHGWLFQSHIHNSAEHRGCFGCSAFLFLELLIAL